MNHQPSIIAHCLIKNEEKWLWYSVNSIINHVDKLLLWDTGSTDGSVEIEKELVKQYPNKIIFEKRTQNSIEEFTKVRQEMLYATKSDWFIVLDGDEIWWEGSIEKVINVIKGNESNKGFESIVVPTVNLVGDMFHKQEESAGRYKFGSRVGHYNLRAINRDIPGLHSQGSHGVWGWADENNKMIQNRDSKKIEFIDSPYLHTTFLPRGGSKLNDTEVVKRSKKLKYELGKKLPLDFYYPEVFFKDRPEFVPTPWNVMTNDFKCRAFFETPLRKVKRRLWQGKVGY